jgi:Leucine-rich repeat (LRR) protein
MALKSVNLSRNDFSGKSLPQITKLIGKFSMLSQLILHHNELGDSDMAEFSSAVHNHGSLTYLDLSENQITNQGFI